MRRRQAPPAPGEVEQLAESVRALARPLRGPDDLDPLLDRVGDARYVLLGEASHGTSEYYTWRAALSRRLIEEKGFSFIAVEDDWPDCYRVNRYVKHYEGAGDDAREVLHAFERWPTWMWANEEVAALAEWLRAHNAGRPEGRRAGFHGLDVYSLWDSLYALVGYLQKHEPALVPAARRALRCFEPYGEDAQEYARAHAWAGDSCEGEVIRLLHELRGKAPAYPHDGEARFAAEQNAHVLKNAEAYYRTMVRGGSASWNLRDRHMADTLDRLVRHHGPDARCIVWAHNTHVGDARHTDMAEQGEYNVGQLVRERHESEGVVLVGFGSCEGSVIAGREWDAPMERVPVPAAVPGSWEDVLRRAGADDKLLIFSELRPGAGPFFEPRGHRAIGVVYRPAYERHGNSVPTVLPRRYDAFLYLDRTRALRLEAVTDEEMPETYPSGV